MFKKIGFEFSGRVSQTILALSTSKGYVYPRLRTTTLSDGELWPKFDTFAIRSEICKIHSFIRITASLDRKLTILM